MSKSRTERKKLSRTKKIILSIVAVLVIAFIGSGVYAYTLYKKIGETYAPLKRDKSEKREEKVTISKGDAISVLLLGIDQRSNEKARSDSMILLTVDPKTKTSKMVSIPRDTYVEIVGKGFEDKINHAHAFGGAEMSIQTVEKFMDVPIDYYVKINMRGFAELVDLIGGIEVNNKFTFSQGGNTLEKGPLTLTSKNVLSYVRMRYDDPNGDFGRQERQREVIQKIAEKSMSFASITKINDYMNILGNNVETNVSPTEMVKMIQSYAPAMNNTETLNLKGTGGKHSDGIWYYEVDEVSKRDISQQLRKHLGI
ncbi:MAG: LCP family protein [Bacillaceae bacterium]